MHGGVERPLEACRPLGKEHTIYAIRRILFVVALSLVVSMTPIGLVVRTPIGQPSSVPSGPLNNTSTQPPVQGRHGPLVTLRVRALVPEKGFCRKFSSETI